MSDQKQVRWTLRRDTDYRREKLDQRLHGRKLVHYEKVFRKGDKFDRDVEFADTWYVDCKDMHDYFLVPYPHVVSLYQSGPFPKYTKVLHGLRTVHGPKGDLQVIENRYAGPLHGQQVAFRDGKRSTESNYRRRNQSF